MRKVLFNERQIKEICKRMAKELEILFDDPKNPPIFIGVMKGALPFMMDLIREINHPLLIDFVQISTWYGTESTGVIKLKKDLSLDITNRTVVIVEDIVDTGCTLKWFKEYLETKHSPKKVVSCVFLDKKCQRKVEFTPDFYGEEIGNYFIAGYGLDYLEYFRNEKEVFVPTEEDIKSIDKIYHK